jgi:hypothetical protein
MTESSRSSDSSREYPQRHVVDRQHRLPTLPREHPQRHVVDRRHRLLTLPSSGSLALCVALPTCRHHTALHDPWQWPPYAAAAMIFVGALVARRRLWAVLLGLRLVVGATIAGWSVLAAWLFIGSPPPQLLVFCVALCGVIASLIAKAPLEIAVARTGTFLGVCSMVLFGVIAGGRGAWGADVALTSSLGMTAGCAWWWYEAREETSSR